MKRFFARLFGKDEARRSVASLYGAVMAAARNPAFFEAAGLPDRFETRVELLNLHMFLVLNRLKSEGAKGKPVMQALTEYMVDDLDRTLREQGIGDVGVAKRMKKMMSGFYGRVVAYEKALMNRDEKEILRALDRNLFADVDTNKPALEKVRTYILKQREALAFQTLTALEAGDISLRTASL